MKKLLFLIVLLSNILCFSQRITVRGIALDTTHGRNWITVILNDTLARASKDKSFKWEHYAKLCKDSNLVVLAKSDGKFEIKAKKSDSLFFQSYKHISKVYCVKDLLKMGEIKILLEPEVCEPYIACKDTKPSHFVFIGEKIKVDRGKEQNICNVISLDYKFNAQYKIIEKLYGNFKKDTISFIAYDHYGAPGFSNYQNVLLFVSEYCKEWIHQKYQFCNVYPTKVNKWAAPYQTADYLRLDSNSVLKPEIIAFSVPVEIDISKASKEWIEKWYPEPYYNVKNGKAIAVYGNYVEELIELKKQTVLKERKIELE
ncbi:hypothetical protein [Flavobacterium sp. FlaQc-48]|uniref:hypothetical protein n=1 Tax=Flavobacterium sp. FlaQc-48 TaxID=3374181 RepID=UPI0037572A14